MSLLAVAFLSTAAFASAKESTTKETTVASANDAGKMMAESIEETEEVMKDGKLLTTCKHTMVIVNQSGEVLYQHTSYDTAGPNEVFKTCGEYFAHKRGFFQALGYEFKR